MVARNIFKKKKQKDLQEYQPPTSFSSKPSGNQSERIPLSFAGLEQQELNLYPKKMQPLTPVPEKEAKQADQQSSNLDVLEQIADLYLKNDTISISRLIQGRSSSGFMEIKALWNFVSSYSGCTERRHLLAAIDSYLLGTHDIRTVMRHLAALNYKISADEVISIRCGCHAMSEVAFGQSLGYKKYQICTTADENTCPRCRKMEGKTFLISEAQPGVNLPPFCDCCRCSVLLLDPICDEYKR